MSFHDTSADAISAAKALAAKRDEIAHIFSAGYSFEVLSDSAVEDAFATGALTAFEYDRDILATARP